MTDQITMPREEIARRLEIEAEWLRRCNHQDEVLREAVAYIRELECNLLDLRRQLEAQRAPKPEVETVTVWHIDVNGRATAVVQSWEAVVGFVEQLRAPPDSISIRPETVTRPKPTREVTFWCNIIPCCGFSVEAKDAYNFDLAGSTSKSSVEANAPSYRLGGRAIPVTIKVPVE